MKDTMENKKDMINLRTEKNEDAENIRIINKPKEVK